MRSTATRGYVPALYASRRGGMRMNQEALAEIRNANVSMTGILKRLASKDINERQAIVLFGIEIKRQKKAWDEMKETKEAL